MSFAKEQYCLNIRKRIHFRTPVWGANNFKCSDHALDKGITGTRTPWHQRGSVCQGCRPFSQANQASMTLSAFFNPMLIARSPGCLFGMESPAKETGWESLPCRQTAGEMGREQGSRREVVWEKGGHKEASVKLFQGRQTTEPESQRGAEGKKQLFSTLLRESANCRENWCGHCF